MDISHALRRATPALLAVGLLLPTGCGKSSTAPRLAPAPADTSFYVDSRTGLDTNDGSSAHPFKTVTHAIATAPAGRVIHLLPGGYDDQNGEVFPLILKPGQALIGDTLTRGGTGTETISIGGSGPVPGATGGSFPHDATVIAAAGCRISGVRMGGANVVNHFLVVAQDVGVTVSHDLLQGPSYGGVFLSGSGRCVVHDSEFGTASYGVYLSACTDSVWIEDDDFLQPALPLDVVGASDRTILRANYIAGSGQVGIQVQAGAPRILDNVFEKSGGYTTNGAISCWSVTATPYVRRNTFLGCALAVRVDSGNPDLGTAGDPGANDFAHIAGTAVRHLGAAAVSAIGNTWPHTPPTLGGDISITGTGSVRWGTGPDDEYP